MGQITNAKVAEQARFSSSALVLLTSKLGDPGAPAAPANRREALPRLAYRPKRMTSRKVMNDDRGGSEAVVLQNRAIQRDFIFITAIAAQTRLSISQLSRIF
ncbi:hypothetical protein [Burkholderia glumae]|uniref:hypothetical protein n=1 Tax=Burkholderia glumae TaxID=337 RepID=UPI0011CF4A49|nr:hypothetical protein [Burkholderia glumae]QJW81621.1 hypothetical protein GAS18_23645 [Burkholderia glumae]